MRLVLVSAIALTLAGLVIFADPAGIRAVGGGSVSGVVFVDKDKDGKRDPGESAAPHRTVWLSGAEIQSDVYGRFRFDDLVPGHEYMLGVWTDEQTECIVVDGQGIREENGRMLVSTPVTAGVQRDLGILPPGHGVVAGTLTNDLNENGVGNMGEPPLVGWRVRIPGMSLGMFCYSEVVTGRDGKFRFAVNLDNVGYWLQVSPPPSDVGPWVWTAPTVPTWKGDFPDSREPADKILPSAWLDIAMHLASGSASLAGSVFRDLDLDAVRDGGEPLLDCANIRSGLRVLRRVADIGVLDVRTSPACANGDFQFTGLEAGTYHLGVSSHRSLPGGDRAGPGRWLTVAEGQRIEHIDISVCPAAGCSPTAVTPVPLETVAPDVRIVMPPTGSAARTSAYLPVTALSLAAVGAASLCAAVLLRKRHRSRDA